MKFLGYNCSYVAIDHPRSFDEILYTLMCFSPETEIKTKNGNKKIRDVIVGDVVLSYDKTTNRYEYKSVTNVMEVPSEDKEKMELTFEDGFTVQCTSDHKFLTTNRGWIQAKDLTDDDDIKNYHEIP